MIIFAHIVLWKLADIKSLYCQDYLKRTRPKTLRTEVTIISEKKHQIVEVTSYLSIMNCFHFWKRMDNKIFFSDVNDWNRFVFGEVYKVTDQ